MRRCVCAVDVPSEPRHLAVSAVSDKSISLRWDEPESDGGCDVTQYVVEAREGSRRSWQRAGVADERQYTALALSAGQQYAFRVAAENRVGVGDWTEMAQSVVAKSAHGKQRAYSSSPQGCHTATRGTHMSHGIARCYLPPGGADISALTPAEACTRLSDPGGMQG